MARAIMALDNGYETKCLYHFFFCSMLDFKIG